MARVSTTEDVLRIDLQGLHQLWALKRRITVPWEHVRGATADPGVVGEHRGTRAPGLHVPGLATIGTFHRDGERHFWDVRTGARAVVVQLVDEPCSRLVVEVDDPRAVVEAVNRAASRTSG